MKKDCSWKLAAPVYVFRGVTVHIVFPYKACISRSLYGLQQSTIIPLHLIEGEIIIVFTHSWFSILFYKQNNLYLFSETITKATNAARYISTCFAVWKQTLVSIYIRQMGEF